MSHECEDCGASFDTLSRLRLHDCSTAQGDDGTVPADDGSSGAGDPSEPTRQDLERDYPAVVGGLPVLTDDASRGDLSALYLWQRESHARPVRSSVPTGRRNTRLSREERDSLAVTGSSASRGCERPVSRTGVAGS